MHVSGTVQPRAPHQTHAKGNHGAAAGHRHDPCVPREFVHRPIVDDILVTSWRRLDDSRFALTARWPHDHGYFTPVHGRHHLILTGETIRQAGLLLCHTELGVPVGHHFILGNLVYTTHPEQLAVGGGPTRLTIDVTCSRMRLRGGTLSSGHFTMTIRKAGRIVATGYSDVAVASPAVYRRIRGERVAARRTLGPPPAPVPHQLTGSAMDSDVLLSPTDRSSGWELRIAPGHGAMVNPANDHIPGMLLLDAAQQAARALTAPQAFVPYAFGTEFHRYAEHGIPCSIVARHVPSALPSTTTVQVTGSQEGKPVFVSTLTALDAQR
ncbi:A-factor biosynthesis hotdog domain-containing protein [Streptomyces sp. 2224.1]|nr:A-factor biosynthesis hotdog protein [Streptomyces sp. 2321.6]SDQ73018.1 A-factor biosynthesis hotdog domain-containing protein [Streptomyces sp. KS_16]SED45582.1 A-factor biosynthesis hotdog domain-containing protein [Streptomyces sp. 2112.3]SED82310.1 A-factor biosynthesis hotdog domain-containing protein [Streptomyces sp. 2224.1]SEE08848.1 A-factor biosynthesis hotdog domain-containing protein [Streptomyces sp. 2133.1]SNC73943.1 A-factor biosynthesis hotdog domain-containing protein [Str